MKKPTIIVTSDVPRIFDDACVERLSKTGGLSWAANLERFGTSLRIAIEIYVREYATASSNDVNREIIQLHGAAVKRNYDLVHRLV